MNEDVLIGVLGLAVLALFGLRHAADAGFAVAMGLLAGFGASMAAARLLPLLRRGSTC